MWKLWKRKPKKTSDPKRYVYRGFGQPVVPGQSEPVVRDFKPYVPEPGDPETLAAIMAPKNYPPISSTSGATITGMLICEDFKWQEPEMTRCPRCGEHRLCYNRPHRQWKCYDCELILRDLDEIENWTHARMPKLPDVQLTCCLSCGDDVVRRWETLDWICKRCGHVVTDEYVEKMHRETRRYP